MAKKKKKLPTESYTLIDDVIIGQEKFRKGQKVNLTKEGSKYFKSINKI